MTGAQEPRPLPKPTEAELAILNVLWRHGEATVRDVYQALYHDEGGGYTTALKLMQVMHAKGLVERDESGRAHAYRPVLTKERTQGRFLGDLLQRVFDGSASRLVLQALGGQPKVSREELAQIRALLDRLDRETR